MSLSLLLSNTGLPPTNLLTFLSTSLEQKRKKMVMIFQCVTSHNNPMTLLTNPGPVPSHSSHPHTPHHDDMPIGLHLHLHPHSDTHKPQPCLSTYNPSCILQFTNSYFPIKYKFLTYLVMSWLWPCAYILCNPYPHYHPCNSFIADLTSPFLPILLWSIFQYKVLSSCRYTICLNID